MNGLVPRESSLQEAGTKILKYSQPSDVHSVANPVLRRRHVFQQHYKISQINILNNL